MFDILIALMALAIVALGAVFYKKLRRAMGSAPDNDTVSRKRVPPLPHELRELKIEEPRENLFDDPNEPERNNQGQQGTSGNSSS